MKVSSINGDSHYSTTSSVNSDSPHLSINKPAGLAIDKQGNLLIVDENNARIIKVGAPDTDTTKGKRSMLASPSVSTLSITDAYAYPVPFKPSSGYTVIHFKGLTTNVTLRIYNISGELVFEKSGIVIDPYVWDVKNNWGEPVASGVYIYFLTDDTREKKIGKIMII
jgi:hypothetical protein